MKKKILYLVIITLILIAPVIYWLNTWWGVGISDLFSVARIKYIYSQDSVLLITTLVNFTLYVFAVYKIFTIKITNKNKEVKNKKNSRSVENNPPTILENSNSGINWESLYGKNKINNTPTNTTTESVPDTQSSPSLNKENVVKENQNVPVEHIEKKEEKNSQDNVINMTGQVTANDVYRRQISDMLEDYGYEFMGKHTIENYDVDFIEIAESDTLVVGIINSECADIIANETSTSDDVPPSWFTNEKKYTSPVWEVKNASNAIIKMINEVLPEDNGIMVKPVVVLPVANISNQADIEAKWEELGVSVVRFMNHSNLPDLMDVLPDKKDTEVLESYKNFVLTLMKYFNQKAKNNPMKKTG